MSKQGVQWCIWIVERAPPTVISKLKEIFNIIGVVSAALVSGGLIWTYLVEDETTSDNRDEQNEGENVTDLADQRHKINEATIRGFDVSDELPEHHIKRNNCVRDEPDGASDEEADLLSSNSGKLGTCSTFNSLVDADMMELVRTAKEARAMIRKLSFRDSSNSEEDVSFDLGVDDETEECITSFVQLHEDSLHLPSTTWRERNPSVLSFCQSDVNFQYFDFDWDNTT